MKLFRHDKFLYEKRNGEQIVQVLLRNNRRELRFGNHITQSAISLEAPDLLQLEYTRAMMAAFLLAPQATDILHIGLGAGSLARFIHQHFPGSRQLMVELSPDVIEVAYRYFDLPQSPRLRVIVDEGARFLRNCLDSFHLIFLDAFLANGASQHLETAQFFGSARNRLAPKGWLVNNVWGSDRENLNAVKINLAGLFNRLYSLSVRADSNVIFFAGNTSDPPAMASVKSLAEQFSESMPIDMVGFAAKLTAVPKTRAGQARVVG